MMSTHSTERPSWCRFPIERYSLSANLLCEAFQSKRTNNNNLMNVLFIFTSTIEFSLSLCSSANSSKFAHSLVGYKRRRSIFTKANTTSTIVLGP